MSRLPGCLAVLVALGCVVSMHAAVAGAPEPGPTGKFPCAATETGNDILGDGVGNGDDFRTATLGGHYADRGLILAVEGSILTHRPANTRSDELLAIAGWAWGQEDPNLGWRWSGFIGGGVRVDRYLAGDEIQNGLHRGLNVDEVKLTYDDHESYRPAAAGSFAVGWLGVPSALDLTGWWGGQLVGAGQYALEGELIAELGPRLVLVGRDGSYWVGARYHWRDGDPPSATVAATGEHEDGWWINSGTYITPMDWGGWGYQVKAGINPESRAAFGAIGAILSPGTVPAGGEEMTLQHDLALYQGGGFGVQLRWYPTRMNLGDGVDGRRCAAVLDYRFGTEPDGRLSLDLSADDTLSGADLRHDQATIGWEEGYSSPRCGPFTFIPYAQAGLGARLEGVVSEGNGTRAQAVTVVVRGAAGVRVFCGDVFSFGFSVDGWLPARSEEVQLGASTVTLNDSGWAIGFHTAAEIAW